MTEYTPSDKEMAGWVLVGALRVSGNPDGDLLWDAWLAAHDARVKRDAAREALDGLADHSDSRDGDGVKGWLGGIIRMGRRLRSPRKRGGLRVTVPRREGDEPMTTTDEKETNR